MSRGQYNRDPVKRAAKRKRQRAAGYAHANKSGQSQMTHASSGKARKKMREGMKAMEPDAP